MDSSSRQLLFATFAYVMMMGALIATLGAIFSS